MDRREDLRARAADYVLAHGLIGLSLRPLAAALGTSDRMLVYYFGNRDALVSAIVDLTTERATDVVRGLPSSSGVRRGVLRLWQEYRTEPLSRCMDVYVQAAATGLIGREPYRSVARAGNERWCLALGDYFARCGVPARRVGRVVALVDSALLGFHLDLTTDEADEVARGIKDLAAAAEVIVAQSRSIAERPASSRATGTRNGEHDT